MDRRSILRGAGAGAWAVASFLFPVTSEFKSRAVNAARSQPSRVGGDTRMLPRSPAPVVHEAPLFDPTYAGGVVRSMKGDAYILEADSGFRGVVIAPEVSVWKEVMVDRSEIMIDDWLDVKGDPDESGVLHARSGWVFVNIGRRDGEIVEVANDGLLVNVKGRSVPIQLSPSVEVIDKTDGSSILSGVSALSPGDQVGMVGLRLPEGAFRATRIWR